MSRIFVTVPRSYKRDSEKPEVCPGGTCQPLSAARYDARMLANLIESATLHGYDIDSEGRAAVRLKPDDWNHIIEVLRGKA
jgi:hypothetical protein